VSDGEYIRKRGRLKEETAESKISEENKLWGANWEKRRKETQEKASSSKKRGGKNDFFSEKGVRIRMRRATNCFSRKGQGGRCSLGETPSERMLTGEK